MGIIAILSSPSSFRDNDEMDKIRAVIAGSSGILHYEVEKHMDIAQALSMFHQTGAEALIILGDRALSSATFEHIIEKDLLGHNPPPIAILPAGDNNIIAENLGVKTSVPHKALLQLLEKWKQGSLCLNMRKKPLIKIEGVRGADHLYGLFFCAGEIINHKKLFTHKIKGPGILLRLTNFFSILKLGCTAYVNILKGKKLERLIRINRNQRGAVVGQYFMVLITSLNQIFLGARFADHSKTKSADDRLNNRQNTYGKVRNIHFVSVENTKDALMKTIRKLLRKDYEVNNLIGHVLADIQHARIVLDTPFVLDGSYYETDDTGELHISVTDPLNFIRLD